MLSRRTTRNFEDEPAVEMPSPIIATMAQQNGSLVVNTAEVADNASSESIDSILINQKPTIDGRPENFGEVMAGVYRSSYPAAGNFKFLKQLKLKTVVTLVKGDCPNEFEAFMAAEGINHIIIDMAGTKKVAIPLEVMEQVQSVLLDVNNYPLLMHCNHGKHRTGCSIGVLRKIMGISVDEILEEYEKYAGEKIRQQDIDYLTNFDVPTFLSQLELSLELSLNRNLAYNLAHINMLYRITKPTARVIFISRMGRLLALVGFVLMIFRVTFTHLSI